jgi:hypothetical protein
VQLAVPVFIELVPLKGREERADHPRVEEAPELAFGRLHPFFQNISFATVYILVETLKTKMKIYIVLDGIGPTKVKRDPA